jgi:cholesterol transport system auxiliary component
MSLPGRIAAALITVSALALAGCSVPEVPDVTYFRLPPAAALPHAQRPLSLLPIEVETFDAEGVYSEQALIYSLDPSASALRTYHYQLWSDPPTHALQTRMVGALRESGIASLVTDRLPASTSALRIRGTIRRFERVADGNGGFKAVVAIDIRIEEDEGEPVLEQQFKAEQPAADGTLDATVAAFGLAVDKVFGAFYSDLVGLQGDAHAR